ncbi:hypothetical protein D3C85_1277570 [compost metagenome]
MIDRVVRLAGIGRNERNAHAIGQFLDGLQRAGQASEIPVEITQVLFELRRRIPGRVHADQHHLKPIDRVLGQLALDLTQLRQRGRANVGAEGVTEKQQAPLALQLVDSHWLAVLVGHFQARHGTALRQQDNAGIDQLGVIGLTAVVEYFVDGKPQYHSDQGNENKDGFLGSSHRFNSR